LVITGRFASLLECTRCGTSSYLSGPVCSFTG
jgi:hypothetical protein